MFKRLAAFILVGMGLVPAVASAQEAAPPTTTPSAVPVPAPVPTQEPTGLGTDGVLDELASACFNGSMQACDDLFARSPADSAYETYGDTCAGRQASDSGIFCADAFVDGPGMGQPVGPTTTVAGPTTVAVPTQSATGMSALHATCKEIVVPRYLDAEEYAANVPPSEQGVLAAEAAAAGAEINSHLASSLDIFLFDDERLTILDPWQSAETPVGDANVTEWGWLAGAFLSCMFASTQIPDDVFQTYIDMDEGQGSWGNYTLEWKVEDEGEGKGHYFVTFRLSAATSAPGTTVVPATTVAPVTTVAGPTTTATATGETTTPTTIAETVMFGVGASTGSVFPACPVLTYLNDTLQCVPTSTPTPPQTVALATDADCPIEGDLEHPDPSNEEVFTFTEPSQMKTLVECILPEAVAWMIYEYGSLDVPTEWAESQATSLLPNNFLYVPTGVRGVVSDETCRDEDEQGEYAFDEWSLAYCPVDGNIYIGEAAVWEDYNEHGDADLWGTISHEWGHRIQHVAGLPEAATPNEQIPFENQADCFSGSFLDYSARYTALDQPSTPDDTIDLFIGLFNIGDPRIGQEEQNHGTIDQRIRAFYVGYNSPDSHGVFACNFYVTSGSIIPPSRTNPTETTVAS